MIMRDAFYPKENALISKDDFAGCFQSINFPITSDELNAILADLECDQTSKVDLSLFYSKLSCWKDVMGKPHPDVIANLNMELFEVTEYRVESLLGFGQKRTKISNERRS